MIPCVHDAAPNMFPWAWISVGSVGVTGEELRRYDTKLGRGGENSYVSGRFPL